MEKLIKPDVRQSLQDLIYLNNHLIASTRLATIAGNDKVCYVSKTLLNEIETKLKIISPELLQSADEHFDKFIKENDKKVIKSPRQEKRDGILLKMKKMFL